MDSHSIFVECMGDSHLYAISIFDQMLLQHSLQPNEFNLKLRQVNA